MKHLKILYAELFKLSAKELFVYSFVPKDSLPLIKEYGLMGGAQLFENEELLEKIFPNEEERIEWESNFKNEPSQMGPNIFFQLPDLEWLKSKDPAHPIFENELVPLRINLTALLQEQDVKIFGLELIPYEDADYNSKKEEIEKELNINEVEDFINDNSLWDNIITGEGYFAGNVPHAVLISEKPIDFKYLKVLELAH